MKLVEDFEVGRDMIYRKEEEKKEGQGRGTQKTRQDWRGPHQTYQQQQARESTWVTKTTYVRKTGAC